MGTLRPSTEIIYESPDGGETVYGRYVGETDRWLVGQSMTTRSKLDELKEDKLWGEIRRAAKSNPLLQDALERAIMIYYLGRNNGKE
jgi:hypothetical protein